MLGNRWSNGVMIGVDDSDFGTGVIADKGGSGIIADPERIIKPSDVAIFVSPTSTPTLPPGSMGPDMADFASEAAPLLQASSSRMTRSSAQVLVKTDVKHVLVCGWRVEWDISPKRFRDRVSDMCRGNLCSINKISTSLTLLLAVALRPRSRKHHHDI